MSGQWDLIIVGGGLGGATLARCMAQRGARVLVLEREREFKDRVRGEFLTSWGVGESQALGIYDLLTERVAHKVPWVDFYSVSDLVMHRDVQSTTPSQAPCLGFYHPEMQELLLEAAAQAGAEVRRGVSVNAVRTGSPAVVSVAQNSHGEELQARLVVGVDGRSSVVRAAVGFEVHRDPDCLQIAGLLMDEMPAPEDTGHLVINSELGHQIAIFPQGQGRARTYACWHSGSQQRCQGPQDVARYLDLCKRAGMNSSFYAGAKPSGPLATFDGAATWVDHPYRDGIALLGDAGAASDPSWGQGLGLTLRDVRVLRDCLIATEDWDSAAHDYAVEHDRYHDAMHRANNWHTELYLGKGAEADARRARAMPLIAQDPTRQPDTLFSGPDVPLTEEVRQRFFGEA